MPAALQARIRLVGEHEEGKVKVVTICSLLRPGVVGME